MTKIDFHHINRAAIAALHPILLRLLPSGRLIAGEYVALNPTRSDRRPGSFKIKLTGARVGCWCDFATGDKGGDIISLVAYLDGISQGEAARMIARMLGLETGAPHYG
jgi:putative DNA primase/helicase